MSVYCASVYTAILPWILVRVLQLQFLIFLSLTSWICVQSPPILVRSIAQQVNGGPESVDPSMPVQVNFDQSTLGSVRMYVRILLLRTVHSWGFKFGLQLGCPCETDFMIFFVSIAMLSLPTVQLFHCITTYSDRSNFRCWRYWKESVATTSKDQLFWQRNSSLSH